jgi:hypothetical protein
MTANNRLERRGCSFVEDQEGRMIGIKQIRFGFPHVAQPQRQVQLAEPHVLR